MSSWYSLGVVLLAYLIGSVAFGILVSALFRLADPRSYGSHNPGATNVLRSGNKAAAVLTLLGDAFKGWLAVFLAQHFSQVGGWGEATVALAAVAVFVGHLWPIFFRFQGGKGVATALGVLLGINVWLALAALLSFLIMLTFFRWVSLASVIAAVFAAFYHFLLFGIEPMSLAVTLMSALLIWRHRTNIERLLAGKEPKLGQGKDRA
jgi:glycerol-3-phosphate acyltransferase PlsY